MKNIPLYLDLVFILTTFLTVVVFYNAIGKSKPVLIVIISWLTLQTIPGLTGFYTIADTVPPRFLLLLLPPLIFIAILFFTDKGKEQIDRIDIKRLTLIHVIRIPVEFILFGLFLYKTIPQLMTFEGRNFDIIAGITAPLVYYFGFIKKKLSLSFLLTWNFISLGLLINIVSHAILSAPFFFQVLAFEQPNIAVLYFPYIWLPGCIVPIVFFSHLVSIRQLLKEKNKNKPVLLNKKINLQSS